MRKDYTKGYPNTNYIPVEIPTCAINGTTYTDILCNTSTTNTLGNKGAYVFTACEWNRCTAANGGAISTTSDIEFTLTDCKLLSCSATSRNGGGIYASGASVIHISKSLFSNCQALTNPDANDGGGGICIWSVTTEVSISQTDLINCIATNDGGGVIMRCCSSTRGLDCSFLGCKLISCKGSQSEGGGFILWENQYPLVIREIVLKECHNNWGGGLQHYYARTPTSSPVQFSFFCGNSATLGKDAYINNTAVYSSLLPFFLHCFSFGSGNDNVMQYPISSTLNDWLPSGTFKDKVHLYNPLD